MKKRSKRILMGSAFVGAGALAVFALPAGAIPFPADGAPKTASSEPDPEAVSEATSQKVSVPAYFYPGATWKQLTGSGPGVGLAVANPHNGPGTSEDEQYTETIKKADAAGADVIGYVSTGYFGTSGIRTRSGSTSPDAWTKQIKADVDTWYRLYGDTGLGGIFFDEGTNECGPGDTHVERYIELRNYVEDKHGEEAVVVNNPGTGTEECYTEAADTLVTFEGSEDSYRADKPKAWEKNVSGDKIWHLVYGVADEERMREVMALSKDRNAGHVYVTPDDLSENNPWDSLPPAAYWKSQLSLVGTTAAGGDASARPGRTGGGSGDTSSGPGNCGSTAVDSADKVRTEG
ncbi:spherulation-specific family 4 protein [Streptomyces baarnensis]|uniref:spherulation-specific family 4 protein n=1 Tax=Streptomyces TaxID=1883 RepID=UPI0029A55DAD|nr:spherulation-specific family 4 protein [Streptomyces sp. ME02-6979.5a]MDX3342649.1 spherulation-specific family 4 protein [Streptomyces sp. ME02-6979.5a]